MIRGFHYLSFFFSCFTLSSLTATGQEGSVIFIDNTKKEIDISDAIYFLPDSLSGVSENDIFSGIYDALFKQRNHSASGISIKSKRLLTKFIVENYSNQSHKWLLLIDQPGIDTLILFYQNLNNHINSISLNKKTLTRYRKYSFNCFVIDLPLLHKGHNVFYIKTTSHINKFPIRILKHERFGELSFQRNLFQGMFIGFFIMFLLYNLLIYFFEKDKSFIYYVLYVFFNGLMICIHKSYLDFLLVENNLDSIFNLSAVMALNSLMLLLFAREILDLNREYKLADNLLKSVFIPLTSFAFISVWILDNYLSILLNMINLFLLMTFLIITALIIYKPDRRSVTFFMTACLLLLISAILYVCSLFGLLPNNFMSHNIIEFGASGQIILFSFALGDKVRKYKQLKFETENKLLESLSKNEEIILEQKRLLEITAAERSKDLLHEKEQSDKLLLNILPESVAKELKEHSKYKPKLHTNVSVIFTDFVNFTQISESLSAAQLVSKLDKYFRAFDEIIEKYKLEKIRTIGDAYLATGGLDGSENHADLILQAAIEICQYITMQKNSGELFDIRIGIHTGPVIAGIVGDKKFTYDIWGNTVNLANKLEQLSQAGKINISGTTKSQLKKEFHFIKQGTIQTKDADLDYFFIDPELQSI